MWNLFIEKMQENSPYLRCALYAELLRQITDAYSWQFTTYTVLIIRLSDVIKYVTVKFIETKIFAKTYPSLLRIIMPIRQLLLYNFFTYFV